MMTLLSPREYLTHLSKQARARHDAWWLTSERTGTVESRRAKLLATLRFFGQEHQALELEARMDKEPLNAALSPELRDVLDQIVHDLEDYVWPSELNSFRRTVFGLLPLSAVDAFCLDRTPWGAKLDGYLVVLNEGLIICAQLLSKAFLLENLDGEFILYRRSGSDSHRAAIEHFLNPSSFHTKDVSFEGVPPEIEGALAAAQMNMTLLLLQFVLLHEMGHIVHQHHALMEVYQFHVGVTDASVAPTQQFWAAEHAADTYALERILQRARSDASRWANFMAIYVFFHWLGAVEQVTGRSLCPLHPPPLARANTLRKFMEENVFMDVQTSLLVEKSFIILESWIK